MYLMSTLSSSRRVARVWRKVWGVTRLLMPASRASVLMLARTDCASRASPRRLRKRGRVDSVPWYAEWLR